MTYEDISKVNSEITMLDLKGKDYAMVPERVTAFRKLYPEGFITTEIVSHDDGVVVMKAIAGYYNLENQKVILGSGFAQEVKGYGMVNKTSYIENCETSAVGRALGFMGLGVNGGGICSAEELANAVTAQNQMKTTERFENDPMPDNGPVVKATKLPEPEKDNPVKKYLLDSMKEMREMRGISVAENNKLFKAQMNTLVKSKLAPDKKLEEYTMEEALALVDAMYRCFTPTGTELKTE